MINIIVASHGPFAAALLASAEMVFGELPHVRAVTLSNEAGIEGFRADFARTLSAARKEADGVLVLCDMQSGTPWNVACLHAFAPDSAPPIAVIAGVNFPMLLQTDEICALADVQQAASQLLTLTAPTLVIAAPATPEYNDDF